MPDNRKPRGELDRSIADLTTPSSSAGVPKLHSPRRREAIRRISRDTGLSESSIYKILANPLSFSRSTADTVRRAAEAYGIGPDEEGGASAEATERTLRFGVILPSRPLYFWREAVMGLKKSKARLEKELGVTIKLIYAYQSFPLDDTFSDRRMADLVAEAPDGYVVYPVGGEICRAFVEATTHGPNGAPVPTVVFNDRQKFMTDEWFSAHPHIGYVGPDCYDEGRRAALLATSLGRELYRVAVICTRHHSSATASTLRSRGMCDHLQELCPAVKITHIEVDPTERLAPPSLARRLDAEWQEGEVDCLYITSGVTHMACAALEKLERRRGAPIDACVIGHELSTADRRYLLEGRQRGYIKQDVYTQGVDALSGLVYACLEGRPIGKKLYLSSIFIR